VCAFHGYLSGTSGHAPTPKDGTYKNLDGETASPLSRSDYPITADCKICGRPVCLTRMDQMDWWHVPGTAEKA